jgi:hypothetical protein
MLDHSASWISALAQDLIDGRVVGDAWLRIVDEQVDLENHLITLERCPAPDEEKERMRSYIVLTQKLLEKLASVKRGPNI